MEELKKELIKDGERLDDLQLKGRMIIQDPGRFCFGIDAVLLSGFAEVRAHEKMADLGTGTGIIPILMEAKTSGDSYIGLEIQKDSADMASRSVEYNGLSGKIQIVTGDIKEASKILGQGTMDVVTSNPPYMVGGHGLKNPDSAMAIARHEVMMNLDDLMRETSALLKTNGRCYFIHRPFRLVEIFQKMTEYNIEPKRLRLVHPFVDKEPSMVLIEGRKGGKSRITIEKPLIIYERQGVYTEEVLKIYGLL